MTLKPSPEPTHCVICAKLLLPDEACSLTTEGEAHYACAVDGPSNALWLAANALCGHLEESGEAEYSPLSTYVAAVRSALAG